MERIRRRGVRFVVGPDGYTLTVDDLPTKPPRRWMIRRKAQVVAVVAGGLLTIEQACDRFMLTREEFFVWQTSVDRYGELQSTNSRKRSQLQRGRQGSAETCSQGATPQLRERH